MIVCSVVCVGGSKDVPVVVPVVLRFACSEKEAVASIVATARERAQSCEFTDFFGQKTIGAKPILLTNESDKRVLKLFS